MMNWEDEVKRAADEFLAEIIENAGDSSYRGSFKAGAKWAMENQIDPDRYDAAYMDGYAQGKADGYAVGFGDMVKEIAEGNDD